MATSSVRQGDLVRVLPGERIPVDGEVLQGRCSVDESMLTGESVLVPKQAGTQVRTGLLSFSWIHDDVLRRPPQAYLQLLLIMPLSAMASLPRRYAAQRTIGYALVLLYG